MAIPSRQIGWGTEENLLWQISKQLEYLTRVTYNIGTTTTTTTAFPSNCIEFLANTTTSTYFGMEFETSNTTTFTVDWGDGTTGADSVNGVYVLEHDFPNPNQEYTVRLCFADISVVGTLNFYGND